jgi:FkbM family methyltransferase
MDKAQIYETLNRAYFSSNPHEKDVIERLPMLLQGSTLTVDVGASLGQYTRAMTQALRGAEIHAIEPDPLRAEQLERNCLEWAAASGNRVVVHQTALKEASGSTPYFVTNSAVSGGLRPHDTAQAVDWDEISVPASTLDDLFSTRAPEFVKIDVEGAELDVLRGAFRVLASGPVLLIELHDWEGSGRQAEKVRALLRPHGYRAASFYGQAVFTTSPRLWLKLKALEFRSREGRSLALRAALRRLKRRISALQK